MSIESFKKEIYNAYLFNVARFNCEEYTPVDDFEGLSEKEEKLLDEVVEKLKRTESHINVDVFMLAPYRVFNKKQVFNLEFYKRPIAIKTYFMYLQNLDEEGPDSPDNLLLIKNGLLFIKDFCLEKKIPLGEYLNYTESLTYDWCSHLLFRKITIYNIVAFSKFGINIYLLISQLPPDERSLFLGKYGENIQTYVDNFNESEKAKSLTTRGYRKIRKIIDDELT